MVDATHLPRQGSALFCISRQSLTCVSGVAGMYAARDTPCTTLSMRQENPVIFAANQVQAILPKLCGGPSPTTRIAILQHQRLSKPVMACPRRTLSAYFVANPLRTSQRAMQVTFHPGCTTVHPSTHDGFQSASCDCRFSSVFTTFWSSTVSASVLLGRRLRSGERRRTIRTRRTRRGSASRT